MRPDEIAKAAKAARDAEVKLRLSESGKSLYVNDEKKTDLHYTMIAINKAKK